MPDDERKRPVWEVGTVTAKDGQPITVTYNKSSETMAVDTRLSPLLGLPLKNVVYADRDVVQFRVSSEELSSLGWIPTGKNNIGEPLNS